MGTHRECGEDITWSRKEDGSGWAPPLELVGYHYILTDHPNSLGDKVAIRVPTYQTHHCDPDKVLAWAQYKEKLAEIEARKPVPTLASPDWLVAREKRREETWEKALAVDCRDCNALKGEYCKHLGNGPRAGQQVKNPHPIRLEDADINAD